MPLPDRLDEVGRRIQLWCESPDRDHGAPPYQVYVYPPEKEWKMRAQLEELRLWLEGGGRGIRSVAVSLSRLLWDAIDGSGLGEELVTQERAAGADPAALAEVHQGVADLLQAPVPFDKRVQDAVAAELGDSDEAPAAVFLYRAGALYPAFRTSGLLDDLRGRLALPVTLLYPGHLDGGRGLRFMGAWAPAHGYRALIVDGTDSLRTST